MLSQSINNSLNKAANRHINFIYTLKSGLVEQHFKSNVEAYLPRQDFLERKRLSRTNKQPLGYPTMNIILTANCQICASTYNDSVPALASVLTDLASKTEIPCISRDGFYYTLQF